MIACLFAALAAAGAAAEDGAVPGAGSTPAAAQPAPAGPLDQQIILVGRDEAALPLPEPWQPLPFAFPLPDMQRPDRPLPPLVAPPAGVWADLLPEAGYTYVGRAGKIGDPLCLT
jgi:hypothetical protein